jgi:diguanylate cyclase (GGDEF)-like protein
MSEQKNQFGFSAGKAMAMIIAISFIAELVVMAILVKTDLMRVRSNAVFIVNAALLAGIVGPPIYLLILVPLQKMMSAYSRETSQQSSEESQYDELTQVLSRRAITVDLLETIAQSERYGNPLTVAMVDVDHLKNINDHHGQQAGDDVLKNVAAALTEALRLPDRVGRYRDEEFLVVLPQTGVNDAIKISERIRESVSTTDIDGKDGTFNATVSIGITEFIQGDDLGGILSRAEDAVAKAKSEGSNLVKSA